MILFVFHNKIKSYYKFQYLQKKRKEKKEYSIFDFFYLC